MTRLARGRLRTAAAVVSLVIGVSTAPVAVASTAPEVTASDASAPEVAERLERASGPTTAAAEASADVTFAGRLVMPNGVPVGTTTVFLSDASNLAGTYLEYVYPGADGSFAFEGVPPGRYVLDAYTVPDEVQAGYYPGGVSLQDAHTFDLTAGQDVTDVRFELVRGASVAGRVVVPEWLEVTSIRVAAWGPSHTDKYATANPDGTYVLRGLAPGDYVVRAEVRARGTAFFVYHPASPDAVGSTRVTLTTSQVVSGIDLTLTGVPRFADVPVGAPFAQEIEWLAAEGITRGSVQPDGSTVFDPTGPVRREAMAAFLYRAAGSPAFTAPATSPFLDVATTASFYREIAWLSASGISTGTPVTGGREFRPAQSVSREAMAAFLYRSAGSPAFTAPATSPFLDVATTHPFYREIAWLSASGISTGTPVGGGREYRPLQLVTREAMAAFLYRLHHPST